jgi:hypothetical protein
VSTAVKRAVIALFIIPFAIGMSNWFFTTTEVGHLSGVVQRQDRQAAGLAATIAQLRAQLQASCAFAADVGSVTLPDSPRPSRLGVSIVTDSRAQWHELHCPGTLPVPPGLGRWARYYDLPAS